MFFFIAHVEIQGSYMKPTQTMNFCWWEILKFKKKCTKFDFPQNVSNLMIPVDATTPLNKTDDIRWPLEFSRRKFSS